MMLLMKLFMNNLISAFGGRNYRFIQNNLLKFYCKLIIYSLMLSIIRNREILNVFQKIITNDLPAAFFIFENASSYCSSFPASSDSVMSDPAFCPPGTSSADDA